MDKAFDVIDKALNQNYNSKYDLDYAHVINKLAQDIKELNRKSGWYGEGDLRTSITKIALIHSEISEGLEALRKDLKDSHLPHRDGLEVELADAVIRILDLASARNLDVGGAIIEKLAYNQIRQDHKKENRAKEGGKKF